MPQINVNRKPPRFTQTKTYTQPKLKRIMIT